jgi:hypothetical protein
MQQTPRYVDAFWQPARLLESPGEVVGATFRAAGSIALGTSAALFSDHTISMPVLVLVCTISLLSGVTRPKLQPVRAAGTLLLTGLILMTPFVLHVLNGGWMPCRTLLSLPLALGGITFAALVKSKGSWRAPVLVLLALWCILDSVTFTLRLANSVNLAVEADRSLGGRLLDRIEKARNASSGPFTWKSSDSTASMKVRCDSKGNT